MEKSSRNFGLAMVFTIAAMVGCAQPRAPQVVVEKPSEKPKVRTIAVSGHAEVSALADEVEVGLGVRKEHPSLKVARAYVDKRIAKVIQLAKELKVEEKDIRTSSISIYPEYTWKGTPRLRAFNVENSIEITLKDTDLIEPLLTGALEAGVTTVHGVNFKHGDDRQKRDEARAKALRAAKEKAVAMAAELGQKIGEPLTISESRYGGGSSFLNVWAYDEMRFREEDKVMARQSGQTVVPGMIKITSMVDVVFELVN